MKILISHPTSNQNNRNTILALKKNKMLYSFITSLNFNHKRFPYNIFSKNIKINLNKRNFTNITKKTYTSSLFLEFIKIVFFKIINKNYANTLYKNIDILTSKFLIKNNEKIDAVYAYEDSALETFKIAKKYNIKCIYELPTGYWRAKNIFLNNIEDKKKLINKDRELKLADLVIIPSTFVKKTLKKSRIKNKKIIILPYGFPKIKKKKIQWFGNKRKLKLLYVGSLTNNKGLVYLMNAIKKLNILHKNKILTTIVGSGPLERYLKQELPNEIFKKNLPHNLVLKEMFNNDILIFPSLFEGFGLVISEAMSCGMTVISTNNTALPDIGCENDSFLISTKSTKEIIDKVNYFLKHPSEIKRIGKNAQNTASKYSWSKYQKKLINIINNNL